MFSLRIPVCTHVLVLFAYVMWITSSLVVTDVRAAPVRKAAGSLIPSQHGSGYEYLDCSACLAVAHMLARRMNLSISSGPTTVLVKGMNGNTPDSRRRDYRTSEIRVDDVLNDLCGESLYKMNKLRINPVNKVRGYHLLRYNDLGLVSHPSLLTGNMFPSNDTLSVKDRNAFLPIASFYSQDDHRVLVHLYHRAAPALCDALMSEYDNELGDIVRYGVHKSHVEEQLCGLNAPSNTSLSTSIFIKQGVNEWYIRKTGHGVRPQLNEVQVGLKQPILSVCQDAETLRRSARREQLRWKLFKQRRHDLMKKKLVEANRSA